MNMEEKEKKRNTLENAKTIMGKIDPALLSAALGEMMMEAEGAEDVYVEKVKKAIKEIYDSIPEGKDKTSIVSKAITELDSEIIAKEVKNIKGKLANIDKETIMEAAKDYVDIEAAASLPYCSGCINYAIKPQCLLGCIKYAIQTCLLGCIKYTIKPQCSSSCIKYVIQYCSCGIQYLVGPVHGWEIDPVIKGQLKEEIIQDVLQRPELSRAMKNMLKKIQDEK
jgi:hypothetical protein